MPWIVLLLGAVCEAVWATALGQSAGMTLVTPTIIFGAALILSMVSLGYALRFIPLGTAYSVWVGLGAALTVIYAMGTGAEPVSATKLLFITGIVAATAGLKLVPVKRVKRP